MKLNKHLLAPLVGLAALLLGSRPAAAEYINVQVNFNTIKHYETSACWETSNEEYTALVYANLDGGGWQGGSCFEINNNGNCTQTINYTPINTTTLATTLGTRLYAWEDDSGSRCSYDSGDDCGNDNNWSHTIRSLSRATWNAFNDSGTSNHKFSYQIYWNYIAPTAPTIGSASSVAGTSFTANWSNSDGNYRVTSYKLYVATDSGFSSPVAGYNGLDLGTATSRSVTGLSPGQAYYFRVTAANEAGTSGYSSSGSTTLPKLDQTITFTAPSTKTYGDVAFGLGGTASSGLTVSYTVLSGPATVGGSTLTITGAGTVSVRASQAGNASYNAAANVDRSFTVNPKGVTITGVSASNKVYDRTATASLSGGAVSGVVGGDTVTITAGSGAFASANVGTHVVTASGYALGGASAGNYTLTAQPAVANASITTKALTVTADAQAKTYGDADPALTYTSDGLVGEDTLTGALTRAAGEDVGAYAIGQGTLANANYAITFTGADLTISKATLFCRVADATRPRGQADAAFVILYTGFVDGDDAAVLDEVPTVSTIASTASPAGSYLIRIQGGIDDNYTFEYEEGTLTVTAKEATLIRVF